MSEELSKKVFPEFNSQEARFTHSLIKKSRNMERIAIFLQWRHSGFKQMGFPTFEDYCEKSLETSPQTAYEWVKQVETTLDAKGIEVSMDFLHSNETDETPNLLLPQTVTRLLHRLPTPESRRACWHEVEVVMGMGTRLPHEYTRGLKANVERYLRELNPETPRIEPPSDPSAVDRELNAKKAAELEAKEKERQAAHERELGLAEAKRKAEAEDGLIFPTQEQIDAFENEDYLETEEEAREFAGAAPPETDIPKVPIHTAHACQQDDGLSSLMVDVIIAGCLHAVRVPYGIIPRGMQPR